MKTNRAFFTYPDYVEKFHCIGSQCEDNCCYGWHIAVDEVTLSKYRQIADDRLRYTVLSALRPPDDPKSGPFSLILRPDRTCSLLAEDKLCIVHKELGTEWLSNVCATYPRVTNLIGRGIEESCMLSCPEAARVVLFNPSGISFKKVSRQISKNNQMAFPLNIPPKALADADSIVCYIPQLRDFTISILQNRVGNVSDRMVMLGMFFTQLQDYMQKGRVREIPELIKSAALIFRNNEIMLGIAQLPVNLSFQMQFLKDVAEERINSGKSWVACIKCYDEFAKGIGLVPGVALDECVSRYKDACERYYQPFMKEREYILENFLVNHIFLSCFPHTVRDSFFDEYIIIVIIYSLIKMHLIGVAGFNKGLTEELVVTIVYSITREIAHNDTFIQSLLTLLKNKGFSTLGHMAILLKN